MSSIKKLITIGILLIVLISLSLVYLVMPKIIIDLKGEKYQTIRVGDSYTEAGATAYLKTLSNKNLLEYEINGNVNTSEVGTYVLTYKATTKNITKKTIRVIDVIDNKSPKIKLNSEVKGCKNNNLIEIDAVATDNYDGDISNLIEYRISNDEVIIKVSDSSHNSTIRKESINYIDKEKPTITLNGEEVVYLKVGESYTELGAVAEDSCDGNITNKIKFNGEVDVNTPGIYKITYQVTDSVNNTSELVRNVIVSDEEYPYKIINGATIYLTFDDGPGQYTEEILNVLSKYNIKATFFVTNQFPKYQHLLKNIHNDGHAIGIHTYSHEWSIYESADTYLTDFQKIDEIIFNEIGIHTKIFRFPGGSSNKVSKNYKKGIMTELAALMAEKGYIYFDWNIDSGDTSKKDSSTKAIIKNVKKNLKGDGEYVILMHDIRKNTLEALPDIIEYAKACGYDFAAITEKTLAPHFKIAN